MCWSAEVSLNTYIIAIFGTGFALYNKIPLPFIIWLHLFSMMQLAEYFIWTNLKDPFYNTVFSSFGLTILVLEPIASMFLMKSSPLRSYLLISYLLFLLLILGIYYPWVPKTIVAKNGHLSWLWQHPKMPLFVNLIWAAFFILPVFLSGYKRVALFSLLTLMITIYTYNKDGTWGSMWCWVASFSWLILIGIFAMNKCYFI
mgnify:CR=1 FL=1